MKTPIRFDSVVTDKYDVLFFRYVISPFHPSFGQEGDSHYTMNVEFRTPFEWFMQCINKTWMEGTYDKPNKNPYFFVTTEPNRIVVSPKCRYM